MASERILVHTSYILAVDIFETKVWMADTRLCGRRSHLPERRKEISLIGLCSSDDTHTKQYVTLRAPNKPRERHPCTWNTRDYPSRYDYRYKGYDICGPGGEGAEYGVVRKADYVTREEKTATGRDAHDEERCEHVPEPLTRCAAHTLSPTGYQRDNRVSEGSLLPIKWYCNQRNTAVEDSKDIATQSEDAGAGVRDNGNHTHGIVSIRLGGYRFTKIYRSGRTREIRGTRILGSVAQRDISYNVQRDAGGSGVTEGICSLHTPPRGTNHFPIHRQHGYHVFRKQCDIEVTAYDEGALQFTRAPDENRATNTIKLHTERSQPVCGPVVAAAADIRLSTADSASHERQRVERHHRIRLPNGLGKSNVFTAPSRAHTTSNPQGCKRQVPRIHVPTMVATASVVAFVDSCRPPSSQNGTECHGRKQEIGGNMPTLPSKQPMSALQLQMQSSVLEKDKGCVTDSLEAGVDLMMSGSEPFTVS